MRRFTLRLLMALVGVCLLAFYAGAAYLVYWGLALVWQARPSLETTVLYVVVLTLVFGYFSYQFGTERLLSGLEAVELPESQAPRLHRRLDALAAEMDLTKPRVLVARMQAPNALALGGRRNGVLVFDRSLFRLLDPDEFETIIAHELAHIESHDSLVQTIAYSAVRTVVGLLTLVLLPALLLLTGLARAWAWIRGQPFQWERSPVGRLRRWLSKTVALVFVVLTLFVRAHSRHREYAADDRAAEVTGKPLALARALRKIQRATETGFGLLSPLYVSGEEENVLSRMLSTHPPMDDRIERLVEKAEEDGTGRHRIEVG